MTYTNIVPPSFMDNDILKKIVVYYKNRIQNDEEKIFIQSYDWMLDGKYFIYNIFTLKRIFIL